MLLAQSRCTRARTGSAHMATLLLLVFFAAAETQLIHRRLELTVVLTRRTLILLVRGSLAAVEHAAGGLELVERLHGQGAHAVVLRLGVVCLVDGLRRVHNFRLDGGFMDDGDDCFVDVVVNVLASDGWTGAHALCSLLNAGAWLELGEMGGLLGF